MIQFLITAAIVLVFVFILVLLGSGMLWVVVKVLRSPSASSLVGSAKRTRYNTPSPCIPVGCSAFESALSKK